MKKCLKLFTALLIAIMPMLAIPASADETAPTTISATEYITKYLMMPCAITEFPEDITFEFELTLTGEMVGEELVGLPITGAPTLPAQTNPTVVFDEDRTPLAGEDLADFLADRDLEDDVCVYVETVNFVDMLTLTRPGHFVFSVVEVADVNELPFLPPYIENIDYDATEFELHVLVGLVNGVLTVIDTYAWNEGSDWSGELDDITGKSPIAFVNTFTRESRPQTPDCPEEHPYYPTCLPPVIIPDCPEDDPYYPTCIPPHVTCPEDHPDYPDCEPPVVVCPEDDPNFPTCLPDGEYNSALMVSKIVTGELANVNDVFTFQVDFRLHSLDTSSAFTAHIETLLPGVGWVRTVPTISIPATGGTFTLRHNQRLVFDPILIGTQVVVTETDYMTYDPSVAYQFGTIGGTGTNTTGPAFNTIVEGQNRADFTNRLVRVPITGLIMNNLPIILVSISVAGFATMVVVGQKRRAYE